MTSNSVKKQPPLEKVLAILAGRTVISHHILLRRGMSGFGGRGGGRGGFGGASPRGRGGFGGDRGGRGTFAVAMVAAVFYRAADRH